MCKVRGCVFAVKMMEHLTLISKVGYGDAFGSRFSEGSGFARCYLSQNS